MIQSVDQTLFRLLARGLTTLGGTLAQKPTQIRFQAPDRAWRQHVSQLSGRKALSVYLVDIRENRKLRSNEVLRGYDPHTGMVDEHPAPARADCHYLITAWSNADEALFDPANGVFGASGEEHRILHEVASLLNDNQPLVPEKVFGGTYPTNFDADLQEETLPTVVLPVEGFPKYAEFWGTMGTVHPWKPAVYYVVTVPLRVAKRAAGPAVTTLFGDWRQDRTKPGDLVLDIGGTVLSGTTEVAGAWVRLETPVGELLQTATSDGQGRFRFTRLQSKAYVLRAGANGVGDDSRLLDVPSLTGEYDLHLT